MNIFVIILLFVRFHYILGSFEEIFHGFRSQISHSVQIKAAEDVIQRVFGYDTSQLFYFKIENVEESGKDSFSIFKSDNDDKVIITGPNGVSLVWGAHYYLKNYCNVHISWDGDQINISQILPAVNISVKPVDIIRYYQNACTSSYSFVWWDWTRWEREIDWMALNGINLALAPTGQEAIWDEVFTGLYLNSSEFTGPAFLAWNRMGNLRNFGSGLTENWFKDQLALQHKILKRMKELDIVAILPGFCGIVPKSFAKAYPDSNITTLPRWNKFSDEFCCPDLLSPGDGMFPIISNAFTNAYLTEFDASPLFSCDAFNEMLPPHSDTQYLYNFSKGVYKNMRNADSRSIWVVQGWMFNNPFWTKERAKAFLKGAPQGRILVLDLQSGLTPQYKRLDSYFGQPFIWCTLLNFGGQLGMYGFLDIVNEGILEGRSFEESTMVGVGITPEGINQNYVMYEFTLESSYRTTLVNLTDWISKYVLRRYGVENENVTKAWIQLKDTAYNYHHKNLKKLSRFGEESSTELSGQHLSKNILTKLPSLNLNDISWYDYRLMLEIFQTFFSASENSSLCESELFQHDYIDVTRQTIQFAISKLYFQLITSYAYTQEKSFQDAANSFLKLLDELDKILGSGKHFLLGTWLESAKNKAKTYTERLNYEFNARNQITLWGPNGEIRDYAAKQWSGLVSDYYKARWQIFINTINESITNNTPLNSKVLKDKMFSTVEKPFSTNTNKYPSTPTGNTIEVIRSFFTSWNNKLTEIFNEPTYDSIEIISV